MLWANESVETTIEDQRMQENHTVGGKRNDIIALFRLRMLWSSLLDHPLGRILSATDLSIISFHRISWNVDNIHMAAS